MKEFLKKLKDSISRAQFFSRRETIFSPDTAVLWGIYVFVFLFAALLLFDIYFYIRVAGKPSHAPQSSLASTLVSEEDIKKVVVILDQREKKFQKILGQR